jgi:streptogramin lyase
VRLLHVRALVVGARGWRRAARALTALALVVSTGVVAVGTPAVPAGAAEPTPAVGDISNLGLGVAAPSEIAPGPDGALWFVNSGNDSIGRITVSGDLSNFPTTGADGVRSVTTGPDGNLWKVDTGG